MKRAIAVAGAILTSVVGLAGSGVALEVSRQGSTCISTLGINDSRLSYSLFGVQNNSTSAAVGVECGIPLMPPGVVSVVGFTAYDRSNTDNVSCNLFLEDSAGRIIGSAIRTTSGFSSAPVSLDFFMPERTNSAIAIVSCFIPAKTANGLSHLTSLRAVTP